MEGTNFDNYIQILRIKGYSRRTIEAYLHYNRDFLKLANKSPREICRKEIVAYLDYLVLSVNAAASTLNLAYSALKSYYGTVYKRKFFIDLPRAKKEKKLPIVLSKAEVKLLIDKTGNRKHKCILSLLYGCGLRVSELLNLKMKDIDIMRGMIHVRAGKGKKDRYVNLPESLIIVLKKQSKLKHWEDYLFTGRDNKSRITAMSVQKIIKQAAVRAKIMKNISPHTMRHTYATHLLEAGTDIRYIQALLGHSRLETTQTYARVANNKIREINSPLD